MDIFLLRHGDAAQRAPSDRERPLTSRGESELRAVLTRSQAELAHVTHSFASPYLRAQQTAHIAADYLPALAASETTDVLVPEADPAHLFDYLLQLEHQQKLESLLLVSHQPLIGVFFDKFCGFDVGRYRLGTSALAHIHAEVPAAGLGELCWLHQPADIL